MGTVSQLMEKHNVRIRRDRTEIHRDQAIVERLLEIYLWLVKLKDSCKSTYGSSLAKTSEKILETATL